MYQLFNYTLIYSSMVEQQGEADNQIRYSLSSRDRFNNKMLRQILPSRQVEKRFPRIREILLI